MTAPLPAGTRFRAYIAALEKNSDVTYEVTEYLGDDRYAVTCVETGVRTFASRDVMRKVEVPS